MTAGRSYVAGLLGSVWDATTLPDLLPETVGFATADRICGRRSGTGHRISPRLSAWDHDLADPLARGPRCWPLYGRRKSCRSSGAGLTSLPWDNLSRRTSRPTGLGAASGVWFRVAEVVARFQMECTWRGGPAVVCVDRGGCFAASACGVSYHALADWGRRVGSVFLTSQTPVLPLQAGH